MDPLLKIVWLKYGVSITLLSIFHFGVRVKKEDEHLRNGFSCSINVGLWRINAYTTFALEG
jgi:hypothetical protein